MTEKHSIRRTKNKHLKCAYKKYTKYILNFEKHIERLFRNWFIDINDRNYVLQKLDIMIKTMIKIYNETLTKLYENNRNIECSNKNEIIYYNRDQIHKNIYKWLKLIEYLENDGTNSKSDPFNKIRKELFKLCTNYGYYSINTFLKMYFDNQFDILSVAEKDELKMIKLYNKVFVPINIVVNKKHNNETSSNLTFKKKLCKCDSLIDNICDITITTKIPSIEFTFRGYIVSDTLNTYIRTSQICFKYLYRVKNDTKNIIKNNYPQIGDHFLTKYFKMINCCYYFVNKPKELVEKILFDYNIYNDLTNKNLNTIMKEFVRSDIKTMYNIINLLLIGNEQNVNIALLLFNLLKDKKVNNDTLSDVVYHNLSYYSQMKIKKASFSIKNELSRIRSLVPENISIEKRLASMVNIPDNVKSYILEKINEIKSGENNYKIQMAINGLMQFPWKPKDAKNDFSDIKKSIIKSRNFLQNVAKKLEETVYGHENSKKVLLELVGKWIQNPESTGQVIGLVGPPGIGKTLLAKSISNALGIPLAIVGLGGMSDSADLIGHSFTYAGAQYGMIIRQMIKAGHWRCVLFFDEVDKVSKRNDTNEIYNALIHITDPNMNQHFQDRFYSSSIEFDLSGVLIVFSYNDSSRLDPILLDRIKEINISAYSTKEKIIIAQNYMIKELCENIGFKRDKIYIDDEIIHYIIEKYTIEAGVRELRRKLEQILLKLNIDRFYLKGPFRKLIYEKYMKNKTNDNNSKDSHEESDNQNLEQYIGCHKNKYEEIIDEKVINEIFNMEFDDKIVIDQKYVHKYLDKPIILVERIHKNNLVGVVNGLYATSTGLGGLIPIQVYKNHICCYDSLTKFKLKLTGNQKRIMRESVACALTIAINILREDIKNTINIKFPYGFHIHVPDGGTPKDGPSAGCAFATAFVSILLNKKVNRTVAMTGEIDLTGKISKIGSLEAKIVGAKKAGVECVYICEENMEDYEKIKKKNPELFNDSFNVKIINHIVDIVSDPNVIIGIDNNDFNKEIIAKHLEKTL
jgi:endopeptidase La